MEACPAVEIALGSVDGAGELIVEKPAAVIEPLRIGILGVGYLFGQHLAVGYGEYVQYGVLAAVLRQAVHHMPSVRRSAPPVERHMTVGDAGLRGIDEHAVAGLPRGVAHEQFVVVRAARTLREEG